MRIAYFDCFSGVSGDMVCASLIDAGADVELLESELEKLGIGKVEILADEVMRKGIRARSFTYNCQAESSYRNYAEIKNLIETSGLGENVKDRTLAAFDLLAQAESRIHGVAVDDIHFHEIGSIDTIIDIVTAMVGLELLAIDEIVCSPLAMGMGRVECQHGILPSPAPATLEIARGLPLRGLPIDAELTTPTGIAIVKVCTKRFGEIPMMKPIAIGYGAGSRDFAEMPNVMRLIIGEKLNYQFDLVTLIETNIDDINPQIFPSLIDDLIRQGALDAWVSSVIMKHGRPGFCLSVLVEPQMVSKIASKIFSETTTSGVRFQHLDRIKLPRRMVEVETRFGRIKIKVFESDSGLKYAPEYKDCLEVARRLNLPVSEVIEEARHAFRSEKQNR